MHTNFIRSFSIFIEEKILKFQEQQKMMASTGLIGKTNKLVTSVKLLQQDYEQFIHDKEVDDRDKLMECQNQFWKDNLARIQSNLIQSESDCDAAERCRLLWDNCFLTRYYNQKIFADWSKSDLELRKLTILLGLFNLKKLTKDQLPEVVNDEPQNDVDDPTSPSLTGRSEDSVSTSKSYLYIECNISEMESQTEAKDTSHSSPTSGRESKPFSSEFDEVDERDERDALNTPSIEITVNTNIRSLNF